MVKRILIVAACAVLCGVMYAGCTGPAKEVGVFYVSPTSNADAGTKERPFASLERARSAIRALKAHGGLPKGGVTVWLRTCTYQLDSTFDLGPQDSGTPDAPVTYRAAEGEEVRLSGGRLINGASFKPVTDAAVLGRLDPAARGHVLQADLKAQGITDYGELKPRGFGHGQMPMPLELFFNDTPMTVARWPNGGFVETGKILDSGPKVLTPGQPGKPEDLSKLRGRFSFPDDRIRRWAAAPDAWLFGYWCWDWADEYLPVASIDAEKREIGLGAAHHYGLKPGKRFYVWNLLEELDQPGEWYLDRKAGVLYFWPPGPVQDARIVVSTLSGPLVSMKDAAHVTLRGLIFETSRGSGVHIEGGEHNLVAGCTLRNLGTVGVQIGTGFNYGDTVHETKGGTANGVQGCDLYGLGGGGIILSGGDRKTLRPGGNFAVNNDIHHFGRIDRTYWPAVEVVGVGNRVANNAIHDAPHTGIFFWGNDHVIEYNDLHGLCRETADAGAMYNGRDWSMRGNIVRYNFIHDVGRFAGAREFGGTMAVYLDDWASGTTVYGNVIRNVFIGVMIGGGHDNLVENNVFANCGSAAVHVDARGLGWAKSNFDGRDQTLFNRLKAVKHNEPPYSERYPRLAKVLEGNPAVPKGNETVRNVCAGGKWLQFLDGMTEQTAGVHDNLVTADAGFVDAATGNCQLRDDSAVYTKLPGFKKIPFEKIGLYDDEVRRRTPAVKKAVGSN